MSDTNIKQQVVDKIKNSTNILVTVSSDPSVDELGAALGLTLLLNKMRKHATAVFSGQIPQAISFLEPEHTFENTVDSLRDFIIALDKEKADHLRYKVEGDVVKIFITPYRTTITSADLDFSQGDYNVDLVLALGVKSQGNLDKALESHGRILHDAIVATITCGQTNSDLGVIDWHEDNAGCLSEMMVGLGEALKTDKPLVDEQIATAFLTGIVAATDRFSNNRTSSKVMTIAAQLMSFGANQQLIASKYQEAQAVAPSTAVPAEAYPVEAVVDVPAAPHTDGTVDLAEGESAKLEALDTAIPEPARRDGDLQVSHELHGDIDAVTAQTMAQQQTAAASAAEAELARQLQPVGIPGDSVSVPSEAPQAPEAPYEVTPLVDYEPQPLRGAVKMEAWQSGNEPSLGGTLNATTEEAFEDSRREEETNRNRTLLTHGGQPEPEVPSAAAADRGGEAILPSVSAIEEYQNENLTLEQIEQKNQAHHEALGVDDMPPLPDYSTLPPLPPELATLPNAAPMPPKPEAMGDLFPSAPAPKKGKKSTDPAEFRIPGAPSVEQ